MYSRATRVQTPPDKVPEAIKNFETNILPAIRKAPGNLGAVLLINRDTGEGAGITYWESAKALGASEQVGISSRIQSTKSVPGSQIVNVERAEIVIMDRAQPPKPGAFTRLVSGTGDVDKLDAAVSFLRTKALPVARTQKGYRATVVAIDRQTGRVFASTVWDTKADLEKSEAAIAPLRTEAAKIAGLIPETVKVEIFEAPVAELSQVAAAQTVRA